METSKISFISALLISMNIMIGAGIYISPPDMALVAGDLSYWGWFASFLLFLPVVLSFSKLAAYFPGEGGVYQYTKKTLGPSMGFVTAWIYFLGFVGAQSLQTLALRNLVTYHLASDVLIKYPWIFNAVFLGILFFLCQFSMRRIAISQTFMTVLKLSPLFFVISFIIFRPDLGGSELIASVDEAASMPNPKTWAESLSLIWKTIPYAIFGYWGFEACSNISHRITGSKKNASRVIWMSFFLVCTIYTLFHFEMIRVMGSYGLYHKKVENFITYAGWTSPSALEIGFLVFSFCLSISYFNAVFSELLSYSFVVQTLAKEKTLLCSKKLAKLNKNSQPVGANLLNCSLTFLISTFITDKAELVAIANVGLIFAFCLCLIALLKISFQKRDYVFCFISSLGIVSCYFVTSFSLGLVGSVDKLFPLIGLAILGVVVFLIATRKYSVSSKGAA